MATETPSVAPPRAEVPMVDAEVVRQIRELHRGGWGAKRSARGLEVARNTVRRYLRLRTVEAGIQIRPRARQLDAPARAEALRLFDGPAEHNAVVVTQLLRERGVAATERVVQKVVAPRRRELRALQLATVRYETAPGHQMQVDFGQKRVRIGERTVVVHLLVAVLSYSRRIFVKAFLAERGDDWREGIAEAFRHFGGVPRTVLGDNARALVVRHDRGAQTVVFHPAYLAFCRDWDVVPRACGPYRARTKGKTRHPGRRRTPIGSGRRPDPRRERPRRDSQAHHQERRWTSAHRIDAGDIDAGETSAQPRVRGRPEPSVGQPAPEGNDSGGQHRRPACRRRRRPIASSAGAEGAGADPRDGAPGLIAGADPRRNGDDYPMTS